MEIPQTYTISKINLYGNNPVRYSKYINAGCPICRESSSWGKKKRMYYFLNEEYIYCHNCSRAWSPFFWIKEVTGMSFKEIKEDIFEYTGDSDFMLQTDNNYSVVERNIEVPDLPGECINLKDKLQLKYYSNSFIKKVALDYCNRRRLFTAINAPKTYYACVHDRFNKNRLIIPYFNSYGKIITYTSRTLLDNDQKPKYLLKFNSEKEIFNFDKIDENFPYIFIFEGPIDSMFIKNGIGISGTTLTEKQKSILNYNFPLHEYIWILDNYKKEKKEVQQKIIDKLKNEERVFLFDKDFSDFKDFNDYCVYKKLDSVDPNRVLEGCFSGSQGLVRL